MINELTNSYKTNLNAESQYSNEKPICSTLNSIYMNCKSSTETQARTVTISAMRERDRERPEGRQHAVP